MLTEDIKGKEVVGKNGFKIGKTKDLIFDQNGWKISHLDVELRSNIEAELGMQSSGIPLLSHNHLPLDVATIEGIADVITLKTTKEELVNDIRMYGQRPASQPV